MLACPTMANADVARIRAYHDGTKHSLASIRASGHRLEWDIMPRPFKVYPELDAMPLPRELTTAPRPALVALADPGTIADARVPLDVAALAHLLYFSAGIVRRKKYPGGEIYFRAAACTGALYHIEVYLVCGPLAGLDAGVYHFGAHDFSLRRLRAGDHRGALVAATGGEPSVAEAPATLVCTTTYWRNAWKYQARAYRHAFWDGGTLLANVLGVAAGVGLPARIVAGFVDADVNSLLDVDPAREAAIALVPVGGAASAPPPPPEAPALALATLPVSAREIDYPEIRDAHAASSLATPEEARAWRGAAAPTAAPAPADAVPLAPTVEVAEPLESVILRRGSTRHFARAPITFDAFSTLLRAATRGIPGDWTAPGAPLTDVYCIVHAVDGLAAGTYAFDRTHDVLVPLRAGEFRRDGGFLDLGQELAADAAVNLYWLADLAPALARFGNRGYRAAQLEGGIEGGKAYLAAYTLGLGATGLTFFDDDVTAFFAPHAAGKSVMFLVAAGHPRRRGA